MAALSAALFPLTSAQSALLLFSQLNAAPAAGNVQSSLAAPVQVCWTMARRSPVLPPAIARHWPVFCSTTRNAPLTGWTFHCSLPPKLQCHWTAAAPDVFDAPLMSRHLPVLAATRTE